MNESIVMKATPPAFVAFPPPGGFLMLVQLLEKIE